MTTEMRDAHLTHFTDAVANRMTWPSPSFRLTTWGAFVGAAIVLFGGSSSRATGGRPHPGSSGGRLQWT